MKISKQIFATAGIAGVLLLQAALAHTQGSASKTPVITSTEAIRPFRVHVPEADLMDLRHRIQATRWPDKETVADPSQGVQLAKLRELAHYWGGSYDWRKAEAKLNALPQFMTTIDSVDIHFIHIRSRNPHALPLLLLHGWPGSVFEQLKVTGPLTDPTAYGGRAEDAFDLVIPSLPGFGFSSRPTEPGWGPERIGRAMDILMKRLGYTYYVAQGGDWGSVIAEAMGRQAPAGLLAIHVNLPAAVPPEIEKALGSGGPAPQGVSDEEAAVYSTLSTIRKTGGLTYSLMMGARPQALGYGLTDAPIGLAAFLLVHPGFAKWTFGSDPEQSPTKDEVLDDFTLYWLTNTAASSARIYWENGGKNVVGSTAQKTTEITVPVAVTVFPDDIYCAPETWARRAFPTLAYYHKADKGGHFAAWEQPALFSEEMRAAFKSVREKRFLNFKTARIKGLTIAYREAGDPSRPTIVLLHGFPSSSYQFNDLIPKLTDHFHVVAPDYPGFGFSQVPAANVLRPTFEDLTAVIDTFVMRYTSGPLFLYLHDIGGPIGMRIVTAHPERIAGLIFQNFTISTDGFDAGRLKLYESLGAPETPEKLARAESFATIERDMFLHKKGARQPDALDAEYWKIDALTYSVPANQAFMARVFMHLTTNIQHYPEWASFLKDRQPKTLIVWGNNDPLILPSAAEFINRLLPGATVHYFDASHFVLDENAEAIASEIVATFSPSKGVSRR